jgi:hypothetical protein
MLTPNHQSATGKKRAVAGIVAALILFVMLFTVGTGYFLWVNTNNGSYSQALATRGIDLENQQLENLQIITGMSKITNDITFTVTNQGGVAVILNQLFVDNNDPGSSTLYCNVPTSPCTSVTLSPAFPLGLTQGLTTATIDTGVSIPAGYSGSPPFTVKIVTQRGNSFTQQYPMPAVPFASESGGSFTSQGLGIVGLDFYHFQSWIADCPSSSPNPFSQGCSLHAIGSCASGCPGFSTPTSASPSSFTGYYIPMSTLESEITTLGTSGHTEYLVYSELLTDTDQSSDVILNPWSNPAGGAPDGTFVLSTSFGTTYGLTNTLPFPLGRVCDSFQVALGDCMSTQLGQTLSTTSISLPHCVVGTSTITCYATPIYFFMPTPLKTSGGGSGGVGTPLDCSGTGTCKELSTNFLYTFGTISGNHYGQNIPLTTTMFSYP